MFNIAFVANAFRGGGFFMYPILLVSVVGLAIALERIIYMSAAGSVKKDEFLDRVNGYILQGNLDRAVAICSQVNSPLTKIVKAGLMAIVSNKDAEEVQTAMDAVALREVPRIEKRTGLLAMLSNMATLLGLLGTITGLIGAFGAVANVSPSEKATLLANSISEAMNCTAFGLITAIPLLAIFGYLQTRQQTLVDDVHEAAVATLNFILTNRDKFQRSAGKAV
jgi:biopolymer transport protein ExbB